MLMRSRYRVATVTLRGRGGDKLVSKTCLRLVFVSVLALTSVFVRSASAADVTIKPGDQVVLVDIRSAEALEQILAMDLDLWSDYPGIRQVPVHVSVAERDALAAAGFSFSVINPDLWATYQRELSEHAQAPRQPFDQYPTLDEIIAFINNLAATHPELCEVFSIGNSIEGRPIWVLHIAGTGGDHKPAVFYHGLQHCREWIGGPVVLYLADYLVNNYGTNPDVTAMVNALDIYLAPCVNPDGYAYTWTTGNRLWRKNRRNNGDGTYGIDLNRNWLGGWGGVGSSGNTGSETYRGPSPFSEPETAALSNFITTNFGIIAYMDYHSFDELILWPYGYVNIVPPEPDYTTFNTMGTEIQSLIQGVHGVTYAQGPIYSTIYQCSGGSVDWTYGREDRLGLSIELRPSGNDPNGFILPPDQILPTCEENLPAIVHLTQWAAAQSRLALSLPNGAPAVLAPAADTPIDVDVRYFGQQLVADSLLLHYRYDGGAFQTAPLVPVSGDLYRGTLPGTTCGGSPQYYFSAEGTVSGTVDYPAGAPAAPITTPVGQLITVFSDNCETNPGWTVQNSTSPALTDGPWDRGVPVNCRRGDPQSDYDGSGQCWLTDNNPTNCASDVDGGYTWLNSPTINLSGSAHARVSFAVWYTNFTGNNPVNDLFKVYVSNNNGSTWTPALTLGPVTDYGWTVHEFTVSDYVTPTNQMKIRFEASDLGGGSQVEAGIDAIQVTRVECQMPACPTILGDVNHDSSVDGLDVQGFVDAMLGDYEPCADMNSSGGIDAADLTAFVNALLGS